MVNDLTFENKFKTDDQIFQMSEVDFQGSKSNYYGTQM